ncbi:DUF983 domain-containing protein [Xanthocytophaga agilis]|uniref:DUF983 domain-containing protein n=1 Tax=Xanthocytophaga agilis TaxID=3048010 RepID=A0AAE3UGZ3_9BACT|nr:DUF983 domain-containing protein [Xanthocytophaga agilis]MDJ1504885.1 DUF983 domain-containing protein [Xanthocytophaga agilis]
MSHSQLSAILHEKCPRCREGNIFVYSPKDISRFSATHENCPVCNLRYEKEPGTFWGAMFVSYGLSIALIITLFWAILLFVSEPPLWLFFAVIIPALIMATPFSFRFSRVLWLHFFSGFHYEPQTSQHSMPTLSK